jgi:hypothetical protein
MFRCNKWQMRILYPCKKRGEAEMMASLNYDLPTETYEYLCASHGHAAIRELHDLNNQTRSWVKHGHEFKTADEAVEAFRQAVIDAIGVLPEELT